MKNHTLAEINKAIPYLPVLRPYAGSIAACILMQQLDFWFSWKKGSPFYKFLAVQDVDSPHPSYRPGDSWCEELSISPDEFRTAFDRIGCRYKSLTDFNKIKKTGDPFQGHFYASFHNKISGLTWYLRNNDLVDSLLFEIFFRKLGKPIYGNSNSQDTQIDKVYIPKLGIPIPNISENTQENTSEITSKNTTTMPASSEGESSSSLINQILPVYIKMIPDIEHSPRLSKALLTSLSSMGEDYTGSNILYCLSKHKSKDGENSIGGMIISSLKDDYAKATRTKLITEAATKASIAEKRQKQDEYRARQFKAETEDAIRWTESEEGKAFSLKMFSDDPFAAARNNCFDVNYNYSSAL